MPRSRQKVVKRVTAREAAVKVLGRSKRPLHVSQIADKVLATPGVELKGATPEATIAAMLAVSNTEGGEFIRTEPGTYWLRSKVPAATRRRSTTAQRAQAPAQAPATSRLGRKRTRTTA